MWPDIGELARHMRLSIAELPGVDSGGAPGAVASCRVRGQKRLASWIFGLFSVGAALLGLGVTASAQEPFIPVMVETLPQVPGARFALDGDLVRRR